MDFLPFSKLTDVSVPPRVRSLLEGAYQTAWKPLEAALLQTVEAFEKELFKLAERAPSTEQQNLCFESMREIRKKRADFEHAFRQDIQNALLALVDSRLRRDDAHAKPPPRSGPTQLSLVDNVGFEESLALSEIAARTEIRHSQQLYSLGYRFAVLSGGGKPIEAEAFSIGPHRICSAVGFGARKLEINIKHRVALFRQFDRVAMTHYGDLVDIVNAYLVTQKVLPHLAVSYARAGRHAGEGGEAAAPAAEETPAVEQPSAQEAAHSPRAPAPAPRMSAVQARAPIDAPANTPPPQQHHQQQQQQQPQPGPFAQPSGRTLEDDQELFTTLRELLAGHRVAAHTLDGQDVSGAPVPPRPVAQTADVQAVLTVLQNQPVTPVMVGGRWVSRRVSHIKQDILNQLRPLGGDQAPQLAPEDSDTMDLVGMLFDHLLRDSKPSSMTHGLLTKLQVPLVKVALQDKGFFTRRNHPARLLLNQIAEASLFWVEDEEQDRPLIEKMQVAVDRVVNEFDDDLGVFDNLIGDLGKHINTLQKKAEVSEKRHVEAAKGREKLDMARHTAAEAVEAKLKGRNPPELVRSLLAQGWTDVLALTLLRQGENSSAYRDRARVVDLLLDCFEPKNAGLIGRGQLFDLRTQLENGLSLVGFHADAIRTAFDGMSELLSTDDPAQAEAAKKEFSELVKQKPRLGSEAGQGAAQGGPGPGTGAERATILQNLRQPEKIPITPKEQAMIDRIKQLPFGTWFEFVTNQQGDAVKRKLSWFSPVTGRCLFVNVRGAKAEERSIENLARDLVRGNTKVVEETRESLIDRTWNAIVGALKSITGTATPAAATSSS